MKEKLEQDKNSAVTFLQLSDYLQHFGKEYSNEEISETEPEAIFKKCAQTLLNV
jgi:hypothetical protein